MKKKIIIGIFLVSISLLFLNRFQKEKLQLKDTFESDFTLSYVVDGVKKNAIPEKDAGYTFDLDKSSCTNDAEIIWDPISWDFKIKNLKKTITSCTLIFKKEYQEGILMGANPEIKGDLIPVTIDDQGIVKKADLSSNWYSYEQKKWANAVILKDKTKTYKNNEVIQESNIESYFVWIPRYRYQLKESESTYNSYTEVESKGLQTNNDNIQNLGKNNPYEIKFETKSDDPSTGSTKEQWLTHPAFTSFDVNGMWVGKFETGYNQNSDLNSEISDTTSWSKSGAEKNENDREKVIIKPNVYSWRNINVSNAFYTSYNYQRDLESHMMKNTEWGAIFYLTQSKYGRCTETSCEEVRINNNGYFVTGYSASKEPTCGYTGTNEDCNEYEYLNLNQDGTHSYSYYNSNSVESSTTGNYYGVFDMAGGSWEYVMGVMQAGKSDARPTTGPTSSANSGFKGPYSINTDIKSDGLEWPSSMYYDLYNYSTSFQEYQRGKLGDVTKEFGPFYTIQYDYGTSKTTRYISSYFADYSRFVFSEYPWFVRGAAFAHGSEAGIGAFSHYFGSAFSEDSFRIVLMP